MSRAESRDTWTFTRSVLRRQLKAGNWPADEEQDMRFLISSVTTALWAAACAQGLDLDRARSVRFSMPEWSEEKPQEGMRVWRDPDGDLLSMTVSVGPVSGLDCSSEGQL
jgi:hypothetical protein